MEIHMEKHRKLEREAKFNRFLTLFILSLQLIRSKAPALSFFNPCCPVAGLWPDTLIRGVSLYISLLFILMLSGTGKRGKRKSTLPLWTTKAVAQLTLTSQPRNGKRKFPVIKSTSGITNRFTASPQAILPGQSIKGAPIAQRQYQQQLLSKAPPSPHCPHIHTHPPATTLQRRKRMPN